MRCPSRAMRFLALLALVPFASGACVAVSLDFI
jgi:hypothetical protein